MSIDYIVQGTGDARCTSNRNNYNIVIIERMTSSHNETGQINTGVEAKQWEVENEENLRTMYN